MADHGARYEMGRNVFMIRTEFTDGSFKSRIYPNIAGFKAALKAIKREVQRHARWTYESAPWIVKDYKVYVLPSPAWQVIDEKDAEAWIDLNEDQIDAEVERIRALYTGEVMQQVASEPEPDHRGLPS